MSFYHPKEIVTFCTKYYMFFLSNQDTKSDCNKKHIILILGSNCFPYQNCWSYKVKKSLNEVENVAMLLKTVKPCISYHAIAHVFDQ